VLLRRRPHHVDDGDVACRPTPNPSASGEVGAISDSSWQRLRPEGPLAEMAPRSTDRSHVQSCVGWLVDSAPEVCARPVMITRLAVQRELIAHGTTLRHSLSAMLDREACMEPGAWRPCSRD